MVYDGSHLLSIAHLVVSLTHETLDDYTVCYTLWLNLPIDL